MNSKNTFSENVRILSHFFVKSGNLLMGIDHFLVVFPSILFMAKTLNSNNFNNNSISLLLFGTGLCNLLFYFVTKSKVPIFIAPSFTFIGFTTTTMLLSKNNIPIARLNVFLGYIFASIIFIFIALLYKSSIIRKYIKLTLPDALVGPLISLIGLDLLDTAIKDSGFKTNDGQSIFIAISTLCIIIIVTIIKRKHLKNASILIGIIAGVLISCILGKFELTNTNTQVFSLPHFNSFFTYDNIIYDINKIKWIDIILAILPATIIVISENITKITLIEKIMRTDQNTHKNDFSNFYPESIFGHSVSFLLSILIGAVPNAIYAENIALMEINNIEGSNKNKIYEEKNNNISKYYIKISTYPLKIASVIAIIFSFFTFSQTILSSIPMPVYGGMELFIFALISAQGVQLLVDRKVNYKKVTNQIITSVTLLTGLSGISIDLNVTQISGLSLAFLVGIILNLFFKLFSYFGKINEKLNILEIIDVCYSTLEKYYNVILESDKISNDEYKQYLTGINRTEQILNSVYNISKCKIIFEENMLEINEGNDGKIIIKVDPFNESKYIKIINDYAENVALSNNNLFIYINENMSIFKLKKICKMMC